MLNIPQNLTAFSIHDTSTDSAMADVIFYDENNQTGCSKNEKNYFLHALLGLIVEARTWTHFPEWHNIRYLL
jgi:hypothetical protein